MTGSTNAGATVPVTPFESSEARRNQFLKALRRYLKAQSQHLQERRALRHFADADTDVACEGPEASFEGADTAFSCATGPEETPEGKKLVQSCD